MTLQTVETTKFMFFGKKMTSDTNRPITCWIQGAEKHRWTNDGILILQNLRQNRLRPGGEGTLGISGWGCAAGTLEPLTYNRASSAKFCYPILE